MVKVKGYKEHVFSLIPSLTVLDGHNKNGEVFFEVSDEEESFYEDEDTDD